MSHYTTELAFSVVTVHKNGNQYYIETNGKLHTTKVKPIKRKGRTNTITTIKHAICKTLKCNGNQLTLIHNTHQDGKWYTQWALTHHTTKTHT